MKSFTLSHYLSAFLFVVLFALLSSCGTTNVTSKLPVQKRKYTKGYYWAGKAKRMKPNVGAKNEKLDLAGIDQVQVQQENPEATQDASDQTQVDQPQPVEVANRHEERTAPIKDSKQAQNLQQAKKSKVWAALPIGKHRSEQNKHRFQKMAEHPGNAALLHGFDQNNTEKIGMQHQKLQQTKYKRYGRSRGLHTGIILLLIGLVVAIVGIILVFTFTAILLGWLMQVVGWLAVNIGFWWWLIDEVF